MVPNSEQLASKSSHEPVLSPRGLQGFQGLASRQVHPKPCNPKGPKYFLWGTLTQTIVVIPIIKDPTLYHVGT